MTTEPTARAESAAPAFRLGLLLPTGALGSGGSDRWARVRTAASAAEDAGFDALLVLDMPRSAGDGLEAATVLGALATCTTSARLGALGATLDVRGPAILVKQTTALDILSGGRALLGVGISGWSAVSPGHSWEGALADRRDRLAEGLEVCRSLLGGEETRFDGRFFRLAGGVDRPRPVQRAGPPVMVAGDLDHELSLMARYADVCVVRGDVGSVQEAVRGLARSCADVARDPAAISTVWLGRLVIADDAAALQARLDEAMKGSADRRVSRRLFSDIDLAGLPGQIAGRARELLDVGVRGFVFAMPGAGVDEIRLAGRTFGTVFDGTV